MDNVGDVGLIGGADSEKVCIGRDLVSKSRVAH